MADDGTVLEDLEQTDETPPAASSQPAAKADGDEDDLEQQAVEKDGGKFVPLAEVAKIRSARREAQQAAKDLEERVKQLEAWGSYGQQAQPYIEALKAKPELMKALMSRAAAAEEGQVGSAREDGTLKRIQGLFDLYEKEGRPDLERAKAVQELIREEARALISQEIAPLQQTTARDRSAVNLQKMMAAKTPSGMKVDPSILQAVWQLVPPEQSAHDEVAQLLLMAASGYQAMYGKPQPKGEPPQDFEPVVTEPSGGRGGAVRLTDWQTRAAREMGISPADFAKGIKTVRDRGGQLE